ncbi:LicD family protein [Parabacteroides sp. AF18-52]|jgi:phosphotransferase|uniref:LicD family protein n=1 Tax=Parabacteroides sp. AF18-52 TaxID=2292242 RepID=UPI000F00795B|nr:LicD family protein [Parabacteroides sp. AF18-52]RHR40206.1 LicD family protein [Parabacteroides sp. AF18-52]
MRKMSLDEMKKIQLDILIDVARFCEENGIRYYLTYGTLLGAVRHKGYIPWDDDIDIMMPRPDYQRFLNMYNNENSNYRSLSYHSDLKYPNLFARVEDTRTIQNEKITYENGVGVSIDIFPLDGVPEYAFSIYLRFLEVLRIVLYCRLQQIISKKNIFKKGLSLIIMKLPFGIYKYCLNVVDKMLRLSSYDKSDKVALLVVMTREKKELFEKNMLEKTVLLEFENNCFFAPYKYDAVLKSLYGDYMKLPPVCERVPKHSFEVFYKE